MKKKALAIAAACLTAAAAVPAAAMAVASRKKDGLRERIDKLANIRRTYQASAFQLCYDVEKHYPGVYIIHDLDTDRYYVGKSDDVMSDLRKHFEYFKSPNPLNGHGINQEIFDAQHSLYRPDHEFAIRVIKLEESGYDSLDRLAWDAIRAFDAEMTGCSIEQD